MKKKAVQPIIFGINENKNEIAILKDWRVINDKADNKNQKAIDELIKQDCHQRPGCICCN